MPPRPAIRKRAQVDRPRAPNLTRRRNHCCHREWCKAETGLRVGRDGVWGDGTVGHVVHGESVGTPARVEVVNVTVRVSACHAAVLIVTPLLMV